MKAKKEKKMKCPYAFTNTWSKKFISYLGGNPSLIRDNWCWRDIVTAHPELIKKAEQFFFYFYPGLSRKLAISSPEFRDFLKKGEKNENKERN